VEEGGRGGTMGSPTMEDTPGAVEDHYALAEEMFEVFAGFFHENAPA